MDGVVLTDQEFIGFEDKILGFSVNDVFCIIEIFSQVCDEGIIIFCDLSLMSAGESNGLSLLFLSFLSICHRFIIFLPSTFHLFAIYHSSSIYHEPILFHSPTPETTGLKTSSIADNKVHLHRSHRHSSIII